MGLRIVVVGCDNCLELWDGDEEKKVNLPDTRLATNLEKGDFKINYSEVKSKPKERDREKKDD